MIRSTQYTHYTNSKQPRRIEGEKNQIESVYQNSREVMTYGAVYTLD